MRTAEQQFWLDVVEVWRRELARRKLPLARRLQAPGELESLRIFLEEQWPLEEEPVPFPFSLVRPVGPEYPINQENLFGANPDLYAPLGYAGHPGIDFTCPIGTNVRAAAAGIVTVAGPLGSAGNAVRIDHAGGYATRYCHLSWLLVSPGAEVAQGQAIALSGNTGFTTGPHLHFDLYRADEPEDNGYGGRVDPLPYLLGSG